MIPLWWVLVALIVTKDGAVAVSRSFPDRASCDAMEATVATSASSDDAVLGWTTLRGCEPVETPRKS